LGDIAVHGLEGVRFYTRLKTVTARWPTGIRTGAEYVVPPMRGRSWRPAGWWQPAVERADLIDLFYQKQIRAGFPD
jgi:hypothetical protein